MNGLWLEQAYQRQEAERLSQTLTKLSEHAKTFSITGGLAVCYYLLRENFPTEVRPLNDLDVAVSNPSDVGEKVSGDFLISHYHPKNKKGKFHIMLIDRDTNIRIDVFPINEQVKSRTIQVLVDKRTFSLLSPADLTCRLLSVCSDILDGGECDPKFFVNLLSMYPICNKSDLNEIWTEFDTEDNFDQRYVKVVSKVKNTPQALKKIKYSQDLSLKCKKCIQLPNYPLATNQQVFSLLGYI